MNEQVNGLIELITRKYMHTHVKAALRYLMDEIGIGSGTEIRQMLKVTAELKLETSKTDFYAITIPHVIIILGLLNQLLIKHMFW